MTEKRDYYQVLGINKNASPAEIKRAYRKLAKKYHPDSNAGNDKAAEAFKEVNEAYDILSDEKKRKLYDQFGFAAFEEGAAGTGSYGGPGQGGYTGRSYGPGGYQEFHFEGNPEDMDDILRSFFGGGFSGQSQNDFNRSFNGFRSGSRGSSSHDFESGSGYDPFGSFRQETRGQSLDREAAITVGFEEAALGAKKRIQIQDETGQTRSYEINIPAGIESGKTIRLRGRGMQAGGKTGDLLLRVTVAGKPGWRREGKDLYSTAKIPFTTAVLGGEVPIRTLYGTVICKIKPGTQSGTKIRLAGKGTVNLQNPSIRGDHYVSVEIEVPQNLSGEALQKLKEFEAACSGQKHYGYGRGNAA